jgi:hypothetical protein
MDSCGSEKGLFLQFLALKRVILGAFANLRKASVSFVMSVRPPARMEQLGSY